jgi:hypothetical protein
MEIIPDAHRIGEKKKDVLGHLTYTWFWATKKPGAEVAQSVEQRTENPRVDGSIPSLGTSSD